MDLSHIIGFAAWNVTHRSDFRVLWHNRAQEGEAHIIFVFMEKGRSCFDFGNRILNVPAGHLVCFENSTLRRHWPDPDSPPSYTTLQFDIFTRHGTLTSLSEVGIPLVFKPLRPARLLSYFSKIQNKLNEKSSDALLQCSILGLKMLSFLAESSPCIKTPTVLEGSFSVKNRIAPILDLIRQDYKKNHSIPDLAKQAGMHPETFRRTFKKATGLVPKQYQLRRKIEQAKQDLLSDHSSLQDIAEELGFCDYSNFHRIFKKFEGVTPQKFMRTHIPEGDDNSA